ncbi:MAG: carbohydrate kinase [Bifidobacteriaceae bacterium]|nr:carbohydrate kinase [Bifidobacteriaceae bacterium]
MAKARALVIGEALIDIVPKGDTTLELPGGSPLNVAVALGRLGRRVELVAWLGRDPRGQAIEEHLRASHVTLAAASLGAARTSTATVRLDATGSADYVFDLDWDFTPPSALRDVAVVHTGSLAVGIDPGAPRVVDFFQGLKQSSAPAPTLTFDPNLRPSLVGEPAVLAPRIERLVAAADVVKASDEDLRYLYPVADPAAIARAWASAGPALVVMTRGAGGALAFAGEISVDAPAKPADVADTVGAGDTFMAGLIDGLWSQQLLGAAARPALRAMTESQVLVALERAGAAAAVTVSRPGANPPWAAELA